MENIEPIKLSKTDSLQLIKTLFSLLTAIKTNDSSGIKKMSFDSIICSVCEGMPQNYYENNFESINMFIDSANINFKKGGLWDIIQQNKFKIFATKYPERKPTSFSLGEKEKLVLYSIDIFKNKHSFIFVKVDNRFRLYAMESF